MRRLITLTTDFGLRDGFVGVLRGVILGLFPQADIIDITHDIAPQDVAQGAFLLANSAPYFPAAAVHLAVVDPGVGSARRPIAVQVGATIFVGPDNGLLSLAVAEAQERQHHKPRAVELNKKRYWLPRVSNTFHGRDIFAPCAARLARGIPLGRIGTPLREWITLAPPEAERRADGALAARVLYIDRYGNIVTNLREAEVKSLDGEMLQVQIGGHTLVQPLVLSYSSVAQGELALLIGSPWKLEIAERNGNAAQRLGVHVGDEVIVRGE